MPGKIAPTRRGRLIQLIHIAKRDLHLDDRTYRQILRIHGGGGNSCRVMNVDQMESVLIYLKSKGFKIKSEKEEIRTLAEDKQSKLIRRLWLILHQNGVVKDASERALCAYVKRLTHIDALQWLNVKQAIKVTESLKQWGARYDVQWTNDTQKNVQKQRSGIIGGSGR